MQAHKKCLDKMKITPIDQSSSRIYTNTYVHVYCIHIMIAFQKIIFNNRMDNIIIINELYGLLCLKGYVQVAYAIATIVRNV